jgi:hypothetical protein
LPGGTDEIKLNYFSDYEIQDGVLNRAQFIGANGRAKVYDLRSIVEP